MIQKEEKKDSEKTAKIDPKHGDASISVSQGAEHKEEKKEIFQKLEPNYGDTPKPPGYIRFVCISDTHNVTEKLIVPDGDVLLHGGDFTKRGTRKEVQHFNKFLASLPHKHKIVIAGNHEVTFDTESYLKTCQAPLLKYTQEEANQIKASLQNCTYLEDEGVQVEGYSIYGSPWQPEFCNWGFNLDRGEPLRKVWSKIPDKTEILITHGPPHMVGDLTFQGINCGCEELVKVIQKRVKPLLHVFGHIHEAAGLWSDGHTRYANACTVNLAYRNSFKPIVIDLPKKQ